MSKNSYAKRSKKRVHLQQILLRHNIKKYGIEAAVQIPLQKALTKAFNKPVNNRMQNVYWFQHIKKLVNQYTLDGMQIDVGINVMFKPQIPVESITINLPPNDDSRSIQQ
jgi:hypothetical protein